MKPSEPCFRTASSVDSTGVSIIVTTYTSLRDQGGALKLLCPRGLVLEVLTVLRLLAARKYLKTYGVPPGEESEGVVTFEVKDGTQPAILKLVHRIAPTGDTMGGISFVSWCGGRRGGSTEPG